MTSQPQLRSTLVAPEWIVALGCVATLVLWSLPPMLGVWVGAALALGSLVAGAGAGLIYHLRLHRVLAPLPAWWWWNPTRQHARLDDGMRRQVMPWFYVGAAGFAGSMVGCVAFLSAALRL